MSDEKLNIQMNIQVVGIDTITPYKNNPRHNNAAIEHVEQSLSEYGWQQPIVVDKDNIIVVGHTRYQAALNLGMKEVPIHVATDLTAKQIKAYRIADNKTHDFSYWNNELLSKEFEDIKEMFTGFSDAEILNLCESLDDNFNANDEWNGMPEFDQPDNDFYRQIIVNFENNEGLRKFLDVVKVEITDKTRSFIYPPRKRTQHEVSYQDDAE